MIGNIHFCEPYETLSIECTNIIKKYNSKKDFTKNLKGYILDDDEMKRRFIIKNLGYYRGISKKDYFNAFGTDVYEDFAILFNKLFKEGFIEENKEFIMLREKGIGYSYNILPRFASKRLRFV